LIIVHDLLVVELVHLEEEVACQQEALGVELQEASELVEH
jgi:hypothetical protein